MFGFSESLRGVAAACGGVAGRGVGGLEEPASWGCGEAERFGSLYKFLRESPEFRRPRGVRHRLATVLAIALGGSWRGFGG